jgi:hypothetical protein
MSHQNEIAELESQLRQAKLEAAIQIHGPWARHADRKVARLRRALARLQHPSSQPSVVMIDDSHPDFVSFD